jgi:plasmid stabilization system protein ParE
MRVRNPSASIRVGDSFETTIAHLIDNPGLGVNRPDLGVRRLGVGGYPYSVSYRIAGDVVEIAHVRHDRRKPLVPGDV